MKYYSDMTSYDYNSDTKKRTQLRTNKHITLFCMEIRQTSSGNVNWISLLRIVTYINPCVVLKCDNVGRHRLFLSAMLADWSEGWGWGVWMFPVMIIMRSKFECFHFRLLCLSPFYTSPSPTTLSPLSNSHYSGQSKSENANLAAVFSKLWTSAL
jgi:hypothetical protein